MKILLPAILFSMILSSNSFADLCADKAAQYGKKRFLSCSVVDWGVTPLSADYQPTNAAPMTAPPSIVPGYKNDYPGIKRTESYFNADVPGHPEMKGTSLAQKFIDSVASDTNGDPSLVNWLVKDWAANLQPNPKAAGWEGKCGAWASASMDPQLQNLFAQMRDGILCNGIPFTKGELKELVTTLYPMPVIARKDLTQFYSGMYASSDDVEDANVAMTKLGVLGQGEMGPADVLKMAQDAKDNHRNMMMDRDPSFNEVWNQPIKKVTDVAYIDDTIQTFEVLTSAEFEAAGSADSQAFIKNLRNVESSLTQNLLSGSGVSTDSLCTLKTSLGENCDDLKGTLSLSAEVDVLNHVKQAAFEHEPKMIRLKQDVNLVKHELIIEYGVENSFASMDADKTVVQSYSYTAINAVNADGSNGAVIRSAWTPRLSTLDSICSDQSLAQGRNATALTNGFKLNEKCDQGKPMNSARAKNQYFTGAIPPNSFKTFKTQGAGFDPATTPEQKAYNKLLDFLATCKHFDAGVDFLKHLDLVMADNVITAQESNDLAQEYASVKNLLDLPYIQSILDKNTSKVQGVEALRARLGQN